MDATLYILCGLPFAGKTTLAKALAKEKGYVYICPEEIAHDMSPHPTDEQWDDAFNMSYELIHTALEKGQSVVFDNANFVRIQRDILRTIATIHHADAKVIYVTTSEEEIRKRWEENRKDMKRHDVPDEDFAMISNNFEIPTEDENVIVFNNYNSTDE